MSNLFRFFLITEEFGQKSENFNWNLTNVNPQSYFVDGFGIGPNSENEIVGIEIQIVND